MNVTAAKLRGVTAASAVAGLLALAGGLAAAASGASAVAADWSSFVASATTPPGSCDGIDTDAVAELPALDALEEIAAVTSFSAAVVASGLELGALGPFTIFAPTNDAIDAIPQNVFDMLLTDQDLLASLISYHVVAGQALSGADLTELGSIATLNGPVAIVTDGATMRVNEADVLCGDIQVADATIFVIDRVLQPPTFALNGCPGTSVPGSSSRAPSMPASTVSPSSGPSSSVPC